MAQPAPGWHPEDIKAALRKKHGPIGHLSRTWGFNQAAISKVLRFPSESITVERLIAAALNVSPHELWPDRWTKRGEPLPRLTKVKANASIPAIQRQKKAAA